MAMDMGLNLTSLNTNIRTCKYNSGEQSRATCPSCHLAVIQFVADCMVKQIILISMFKMFSIP